MSNELSKLPQKDNPISTNRLVDILQTNDKIQQRADMVEYLGLFLARGKPKFDELFKIPRGERIVDLPSVIGPKNTLKFINIPIEECVRACGLQNSDLSIDISAQIMGEAYEDNLSLQDVFIFARSFVSGKYGKIYGQLTLLAFMEKFEEYRQERHEAIINYREEQHANYKSAGIAERDENNRDDFKSLQRIAVYEHYSKTDNKSSI